jgi:4-diphosphocytidyl-2-C-methyl-D-erythritol kinase
VSATAAERAYAKINLSLLLGPTRPDGRHELVTLFDSIDLVDGLDIAPRNPRANGGDGGEPDVVRCAGVSGENLVTAALRQLRAAGWAAPPLQVTITKRIPVAAGMGGGSADAAALLRAARRLAPVDDGVIERLARGLGADVPAQLAPGPSLGTGAGEIVTRLPGLPPYGVLVLPQPFGLSTPDVYREADRLGLPRAPADLEEARGQLARGLPTELPERLLVNDLQPAALSLAPQLTAVLELATGSAGADLALVCGSGPTVIGLFLGEAGPARAREAATRLTAGGTRALAAEPVGRGPGLDAANLL